MLDPEPIRPPADESTVSQVDRGSTFALRRSTVDLCLGGQSTHTHTHTHTHTDTQWASQEDWIEKIRTRRLNVPPETRKSCFNGF